VITNPGREATDTAEIARMAKRRGRGSAGAHKASVLGAATVPVLGAVPAAEVVRAAPEVDHAGEVVAASADGARSADSASTISGKSITRIRRGCADTSLSEARSSRGASSARAPGTSVR